MGEVELTEQIKKKLSKNDSENIGSLDLSSIIPEFEAGQRKSVVLFDKLIQVQEKLKKKEEECEILTKEQILTGEEIQDFTASLFEESNKLIQEAHLKKLAAERELADALSKIEILEAEVTALKKMVTSNFDATPKENKLNPAISNFIKGHKRSTSHHSFVKQTQEFEEVSKGNDVLDQQRFELFKEWRMSPKLDEHQEFIKDLIEYDIHPCLCFPNKELSARIQKEVFSNTLAINPLNKLSSKRCCHLLTSEVFCEFALMFETDSSSFIISRPARDRIIAVCDLVTYLRYVILGLIKSQESDTFKEILRCLKRMCLARLGVD